MTDPEQNSCTTAKFLHKSHPIQIVMAVFNGIFSLVLALRFTKYSRIIMDQSKFHGKVNLLSHNVKN